VCTYCYNWFTLVKTAHLFWSLERDRPILVPITAMRPLFVVTRESRMLRASLPSSGRLSVRLSDTLVICIKTVQARITKSSLWASPRCLVYLDKISCHWVQGFPSNEGVEEGYPPKRRHFAVIDSNNVKTVADRYINAASHNKHW